MTLMTGAKCQGGAFAADVADPNFVEIEARLLAGEAAIISNSVSATLLGVSVVAYGADPTGVADSTDAIERALEVANALPPGTWETGFDPYIGAVTRVHRSVFLPAGVYRVTRPIPIRYMAVSIIGAATWSLSLAGTNSASTLLIDHGGHAFALDATYRCWNFTLVNVGMIKNAAYTMTGNGIFLSGNNYTWGPTLIGMSAINFLNGVYLNPDVTGGHAKLTIQDSLLYACANWGLYIPGTTALSMICGSSIVQNGVGGAYLGGKALIVENNDFEGQYRPLEILGSSASYGVAVRGNYFEANGPGGSTVACIYMGSTSRFEVKENQYSNITIPHVVCKTCNDGDVDEDTGLVDCANVRVKGRAIIQTAIADGGTQYLMKSSLNLSQKESAIKFSAIPDTYTLVHPTPDTLVRIGPYNIGMESVTGGVAFRTSLTGACPAWAANEYLILAFAIKYTVDIPYSTPGVLVMNWPGAGSVSLFTVADVDVGDVVIYQFVARNVSGGAFAAPRCYVYPYGAAATPKNGAYVSRLIAWTQASVADGVQLVNPLDALGRIVLAAAPVANAWVQGEVVYHDAPASGGQIGWVCTTTANPATWKAYGAIA